MHPIFSSISLTLYHSSTSPIFCLLYFIRFVLCPIQITECYNTTGDYDFQIKVYAHDMKDYQDFMLNTLGNIDCIGSLHSIIVIGEIKDSHCIPVNRCLVK